MEKSLNQQAYFEYTRALHLGQKEYSACLARGARGNLPSLDELTSQTRIIAYMKQPQREIPLSRVGGTYTAARAKSFSCGFMPLLPEPSEFSSKWMSLCASHMGEGLRDPVQVYEYLWQYYVIEGNKRVSILKHFHSPTVRADITRMVPQLDERDPEIAVYYAFLRYDKTGHFKNIRLSGAEKYQQLAQLEARLTGDIPARSDINYNAMYLQFEAAYERVPSPLMPGDAFLEYLLVYGLPLDTTLSKMEEQLQALLPHLTLISRPKPEPTLVLSPKDAPTPGIITRLFGGKRGAHVVFAYPEGRTEDNWIGAHEKGRRVMQEKLGDQVRSSFVDGLTPANLYHELSKNAKDADLLLITAGELALPSLRFSLEHPDCMTLIYSRVREDFRLTTYYGRYYEAVFLCGMAAGMATRARKVAYITPRIDYMRHTADINAFGLGVKAVCPDADVCLTWRGVLPNQPDTCALGLLAAAQAGCDIAYTPRYPGLRDLDLPERIFSFVGRISPQGEPTQYLAAPQWDWGRFYTEIARNYLNGSLDILRVIDQGDPGVTGLWWGIGARVLRFLVSPQLGASGEQMLQFIRSSIGSGSFNPYHGPITDLEGNLRVGEENVLKPYDILNMEWLGGFIRVIA